MIGILRGLMRLGRALRREALFYRKVLRHPRTPRTSRVLLWLALAYALSPVDLVPDWIPLLGQLDDLIIVPALVAVALWMTPRRVLAECREGFSSESASALERSQYGHAAGPDTGGSRGASGG